MTSRFAVSGLTKTYGANVVVDSLDLEIEQGEFLVLLGPSGCGKTTTLRCLAGLETPQGGSISFAGRTVFDAASKVHVPAHKRNIGMVFQSYALWPHMTVAENIRYPLTVRSEYFEAHPSIAQFLRKIGRRKLIMPTYEALAATPDGHAFATQVFAMARPGYHPITTGSVEKTIAEAKPTPDPVAVPQPTTAEPAAAPAADGAAPAR